MRKRTHRPTVQTPRWDPVRRVLKFQGRVVKHFRRYAPSQLLILNAFQDAGWPERIPDPLPSRREHEGHKALRDAVANLNRRELEPLIHFSTEEHEEYVAWHLAAIDAQKRAETD